MYFTDGVCGIRLENDLWRASQTQFPRDLNVNVLTHLHHHRLFFLDKKVHNLQNFNDNVGVQPKLGWVCASLMVFVVSGLKMISGGHPKHGSQETLT